MISLAGDVPAAAFFVGSHNPRAVVVCKLGFRIEGNQLLSVRTPLVGDQNDSGPGSGLTYPSDYGPPKPRAEVAVVGSAYAPEGRAVNKLTARIAVGMVDKTIEAHADQSIGADGTVYQGSRFTEMPLTYERSWGGPGTLNPYGRHATSEDAFGKRPLPNWVRPGEDPLRSQTVVGLGPQGASWPSRLALLGGRKLPQSASDFAADWDPRAFQMAPTDQQQDALSATSAILLENLTVGGGVRKLQLPGLSPRVTFTWKGALTELPVRLDTLILDTDRGLVVALFRGETATTDAGQLPDFRVHVGVASGTAMQVSSETLPRIDLGVEDSGLPFSAGGSPSHDEGPNPTREMPAIYEEPLRNKSRTAPPVASEAATPFAAPRPAVLPHFAAPISPAPIPLAMPPAPIPAHRAPAVAPQQDLTAAAKASPWIGGMPSYATSQVVTRAANLVQQPLVALAPQAEPVVQSNAPRALSRDVSLAKPWFASGSLARLRKLPDYRGLLQKSHEWPLDPDPELSEEQASELRDVQHVMSHAEVKSEHDLRAALAGGMGQSGNFAARLLLIEGELSFEFDPLARLRAMAAAGEQLSEGPDDLLGTEARACKSFLEQKTLLCSQEVALHLCGKLAEAFARTARVVGPDFLRDQAERGLLEKRAFLEVQVFGKPHFRASYCAVGSDRAIALYVPTAARDGLPLFQRLRARLLAEPRFQESQYDNEGPCLLVRALSRVIRG